MPGSRSTPEEKKEGCMCCVFGGVVDVCMCVKVMMKEPTETAGLIASTWTLDQ